MTPARGIKTATVMVVPGCGPVWRAARVPVAAQLAGMAWGGALVVYPAGYLSEIPRGS